MIDKAIATRLICIHQRAESLCVYVVWITDAREPGDTCLCVYVSSHP